MAEGNSRVFEVSWSGVEVYGLVGPASGLYAIRGDTINYPGVDGTVGVGSLRLPLVGQAALGYTVYRNYATPAYRALTVCAGQAPLTIARPGTAPVYLDVDAGDWTYMGIVMAQNEKFDVFGWDRMDFGVHDMKVGNSPVSGRASGISGDTDSLFVDGTKHLEIRLTNSGTCPIALTCPPAAAANLAAGTSQTFTDLFTQFSWTYQGAGGAATITVAAH